MMKIETLKIEKLFNRLDYNIVFKEGALTLITGPNGYGKTSILNIIFNLFAKRFFFFQKLAFESITLTFDDGGILLITKKENEEKSPLIELQYTVAGESYTYAYGNESTQLFMWLKINGLIPNISPSEWRDRKTNRVPTIDDFLIEKIDLIPSDIFDNVVTRSIEPHISNLLNAIPIYLIKEQRLTKLLVPVQNDKPEVTYNNTIEEYAGELKNIIQETQIKSLQQSQELDSSFPKRLMLATSTLSEKEFNQRSTDLLAKQAKLQEYGLSTSKLEKVSFDKENNKALSIYLEDSEKKAHTFDVLLNRINLFTELLLAKQFAFKKIRVDSTDGFVFYADEGERLNLTDLSSGEKHEVILLYELLFKSGGNALFLIDEPETSLHVTWQHVFIKDLLRVAQLRKLRFVVATHSPQVINDYWDLSIDLYDLAKNESHGS